MQRNHCVYIHTNLINNMVYIGQTNNIKNRWMPNRYKNSPRFYAAIQEFGWDNFSHKILEDNLTQNEADEREKYYIALYDSQSQNKGYNSTKGGKGSYPPMAGEKNPFYGKKHSEQSLELMKQKKYGGNNPNAKKVRCLNTDEIFPSCREASEWCHIPRQNINRCCVGGRPSAGKHPITGEKLRWEYVNEV